MAVIPRPAPLPTLTVSSRRRTVYRYNALAIREHTLRPINRCHVSSLQVTSFEARAFTHHIVTAYLQHVYVYTLR